MFQNLVSVIVKLFQYNVYIENKLMLKYAVQLQMLFLLGFEKIIFRITRRNLYYIMLLVIIYFS